MFGRRRYDRAAAAARAELDAALARHDQELASGLAELMRQQSSAPRTTTCTRSRVGRHRGRHRRRRSDAVGTLAARSLNASTALRGLIERGRTTYDAAARELVLEIDIPDTDVVPRERGWKYIVSRTSVVPSPTRPAEISHDLCRARRSTRPRRPGRLLPLHRMRTRRCRLRQRPRPDNRSRNRKAGPSMPRHRHDRPGDVQGARPAPSETRPESMPAKARRRALAPST